MAEKISVSEALDRIERHVAPALARRIALDAEAYGMVLAQPVKAAADAPPFDCSAMDGFALASSETLEATRQTPCELELAADIPASNRQGILRLGTAAPISTGAPVPAGADAVVAKERCRLADGRVVISDPISPGLNVRRQGEDIFNGALVANAGTILSPALIGALLVFGVPRVEVRPRPGVTIIPTGSEFASPGPSDSAMRIDSNGPMIGAMCRSLDLNVRVSDPVPDDPAILRMRLESLLDSPSADMILSTGGVSVGSHDHVREALEMVGARIVFHGVAMRPGKPILFAVLPDDRLFFGLPGNPVAALVGFRFFVVAAIRRMLGLDRERGRRIDAPQPARDGVAQFLRARLTENGAVVLADDQRSHVMRSLIESDHWVRLDREASGSLAMLYPQEPHFMMGN